MNLDMNTVPYAPNSHDSHTYHKLNFHVQHLHLSPSCNLLSILSSTYIRSDSVSNPSIAGFSFPAGDYIHHFMSLYQKFNSFHQCPKKLPHRFSWSESESFIGRFGFNKQFAQRLPLKEYFCRLRTIKYKVPDQYETSFWQWQAAGNRRWQSISAVYCILAGPVERLDVQMLFDPFEETFHLPTFPIKFSNGQVGMCEVIGQEPIDISRGIILIHNHTGVYPDTIGRFSVPSAW